MQELREAIANLEPKHESEIASLINSYRSSYSKWAFELRHVLTKLLVDLFCLCKTLEVLYICLLQ